MQIWEVWAWQQSSRSRRLQPILQSEKEDRRQPVGRIIASGLAERLKQVKNEAEKPE